MSNKPHTLKVTLGEERRKEVEQVSKELGKSLSETINTLLDLYLGNYGVISECAEIDRRPPLSQADLWLKEGEVGQLAIEFLRALLAGDYPTNSLCIKLASLLGCSPEEVMKIRDHAANGANGEAKKRRR